MRETPIWSIAALAAIGAFAWTLASSKVPEREAQQTFDRLTRAETPNAPPRLNRRAAQAANRGALRRAIELQTLWLDENPQDPGGWHTLGGYFESLGDMDNGRDARERAIDLQETALESDQLDHAGWMRLGDFRDQAGDIAGAVEAWMRAGELRTEQLMRGADASFQAWESYMRVLSNIAESASLADLETFARTILDHEPPHDEPYRWYRYGWICDMMHEPDKAVSAWKISAVGQQEVAERTEREGRRSERSREWYNAACFWALAGQTESALDAWDNAIANGWNNATWARRDVDLKSIWQHPRFIDGLQRIGG